MLYINLFICRGTTTREVCGKSVIACRAVDQCSAGKFEINQG